MIRSLLHKIFGTRNQRLLKSYTKIVEIIGNLEPELRTLSDLQLQQKTALFKERFTSGETLDSLLPEVFAVCREASFRVLNMRHFDVQLIGGIVLHAGKIAEMRTGEGKTLVATLAVYLNAIAGAGVHVVTVNDYLARRDASEMGKLYNFLGLSVGINLPDMSHAEKQAAYACDVTYGTNNEFGFDYLRDNMVFDYQDKVQRPLNFAVVDEVDSILIDEARTPLIISGPAEDSNDLYLKLDAIPNHLTRQVDEESEDGDFWVDEKNHNVVLSESGHIKIEELLIKTGLLSDGDSLYHPHNIGLMHHLLAALKAHYIYIRDQHYVLQDGEVVIVDEFTGRLMPGRRWSDGLHQAIEAKEKVEIQRENQTMATVTFQNYFRMYKKLSGMTGTADTEAYEFQQIYGLETIVIPTNQPMIRLDLNDKIYMTLADKYAAIVTEVKARHEHGQPVLVGTTSVENSEIISSLLGKSNLKHEVLNAKQHNREAEIIIQAGRPYAITVATNMAGRGTDIILGGNPKPEIANIEADTTMDAVQKKNKIDKIMQDWRERNSQVLAAGGLKIIGSERHESRRIDNQLRGRSGRQGDPGSSSFYLSLEDPLLRIFGGERMRGMMQKLGMAPGESIEHKWLSRSIESAQRKVEGHNFDIRKQLLDYDDVANEQRRVIYQQRDEVLTSVDLSDISDNMITYVLSNVFDRFIEPDTHEEEWDVVTLEKTLADEFKLSCDIKKILSDNPKMGITELKQIIIQLALDKYHHKMAKLENSAVSGNVDNQLTHLLRSILIQHIDYHWREHLTTLEQLRQGIHLRGYAQKDPKQEYKYESFNLFAAMLDAVKNAAVKTLLTIEIRSQEELAALEREAEQKARQQKITLSHTNPHLTLEANTEAKVSRNAPCSCGSGKKYKHCCGKLT